MIADGCTCTDPVGSCIMAAFASNPAPTQFSSCSRTQLQTGLSTKDLDRCLMNEPQVTVADPICENGIRERDEICDCGTVAVSYILANILIL